MGLPESRQRTQMNSDENKKVNYFQTILNMDNSKNTLLTTLKKMGRHDKIIVFNVLIIVTILVYDSLVTLFRVIGRSISLEDIFGLTHIRNIL
jgi:hypothetical protein